MILIKRILIKKNGVLSKIAVKIRQYKKFKISYLFYIESFLGLEHAEHMKHVSSVFVPSNYKII